MFKNVLSQYVCKNTLRTSGLSGIKCREYKGSVRMEKKDEVSMYTKNTNMLAETKEQEISLYTEIRLENKWKERSDIQADRVIKRLEGTVDVIIPTYKPDASFDTIIERLQKQTVKPHQIILLNTRTGNDKDAEKLAAKYGKIENLRMIHIEKAEFDHGGTRNYGATLSDAEFMLYMTQDAIPHDKQLIERLLEAMQQENVAAAYARQLPRKDADIIEAYTRSFNYPEESSIKSKENLEQLGIKTYFCSNACAIYRKSVYEQLGGFVKKTIFNEDMIMASKIIQAGYSIAYAAKAKVIHSHHYTWKQQFSRNFDLAVSQRQYGEVFEGIKSESEGIRLVKKTAGYLKRNHKAHLIPGLIMESGFKYMGYQFGYHYDKLPKKLIKKWSMNKGYWE